MNEAMFPNYVPQAMGARVVGIARQQVHQYIQKGMLKAYDVYSEKWIRLSELETLREELTKGKRGGDSMD